MAAISSFATDLHTKQIKLPRFVHFVKKLSYLLQITFT